MSVSLPLIAGLAMSAAFQAAPSGGAPATDARGYPVTSNPAETPAGANGTAGTGADPFAPRPSAGDYPTCTREVTDNCKQAHERGRRPR